MDYKEQGKRNRINGADTERRARADLERDGWIINKWRNNVKDDKLIPAKNYFIRGKGTIQGTGFPDFIAFRTLGLLYEVIGVEVKSNGYLSPEEKEKCKWLLENKVFSKILIASRDKINNRIEIKYKVFGVKNE